MSLSSHLVECGLVTMRQAEEAIARQVLYGGDLVTNLLEVTLPDEQGLLNAHGTYVGMAPAMAGELPSPPARARELLPKDVAIKRSIYPLELTADGEQLVIAVSERLSPDDEEQLMFALSVPLVQRIATLVRLRQAIAREYGAPLGRRFERLVARLGGEQEVSSSLYPPLLREAPQVQPPPRAPSVPPPPALSRIETPLGVQTTQSSSPRGPSVVEMPTTRPTMRRLHELDEPLHEPTPTERQDLPPVVASAPELVGEPPTKPSSVDPAARRERLKKLRAIGTLVRDLAPASRAVNKRPRGPVTFEQASRELVDLDSRGAVFDLFFDFARQFFEYSAFFSVQGDTAEGRDAFGPGQLREHVQGLALPLDLPSSFEDARTRRAPVIRTPVADTLDEMVVNDLLRKGIRNFVVLPLFVRTRLVGMLYGDAGDAGVELSALAEVLQLSELVGVAFERIIVKKKGGTSVGPLPPSRVPEPRKIEDSTRRMEAMRSVVEGAASPAELPSDEEGKKPITLRNIAPPPRNASVPPPPARRMPSTPPPPTAAAVSRPSGPPIPREDDGPFGIPMPAPSSETIVVPLREPPPSQSSLPVLPSVMVDMEEEGENLVALYLAHSDDERVLGDLLRLGSTAMPAIMKHFPGSVSIEPQAADEAFPPVGSCGPLLRLLVEQRRVALASVLDRLSSTVERERFWATLLLTELTYAEGVSPLVPRFLDESRRVRRAARLAGANLARLYGGDLARQVQSLIFSEATPREERLELMRVLVDLRIEVSVPTFIEALASRDPAEAEIAELALGDLTMQDHGRDAKRWTLWWGQNSSRHRIEWLIDALLHDDERIREKAGDELKSVTKEYFGYYADLPRKERERAQARYREWWQIEGRHRFGR